MQRRARRHLLKSTRDNVNSYQAKQYMGPRILCLSFFKNIFFLALFYFCLLGGVCFVSLTFF